MPLQTPFPVSGTITNINGNPADSITVDIYNLVNGGFASTITE